MNPTEDHYKNYKRLLADSKAPDSSVLKSFLMSSMWSWSCDPMRPSMPSIKHQDQNPFELFIADKVNLRHGDESFEKSVATGSIIYKESKRLIYIIGLNRTNDNDGLKLYLYHLVDDKVKHKEVGYNYIEPNEIFDLIRLRHQDYVAKGLYEWKLVEQLRKETEKRFLDYQHSKDSERPKRNLNDGSWAGYENFGRRGVNDIFDGDGSLYWNID